MFVANKVCIVIPLCLRCSSLFIYCQIPPQSEEKTVLHKRPQTNTSVANVPNIK